MVMEIRVEIRVSTYFTYVVRHAMLLGGGSLEGMKRTEVLTTVFCPFRQKGRTGTPLLPGVVFARVENIAPKLPLSISFC